MKASRHNGFTLIEVLIVIVIMAVLAATVAPQFSSSSEGARTASIDFSLHTLKGMALLYQAHHNNKLPSTITAGDMLQLTSQTDKDGTVNAASGAYGPYLLEGFPVNPITNSAQVVVATSDAATALAGAGWGYDATTGMFYAGKKSP